MVPKKKIDEKVFCCDICNDRFSNKKLISNHIATHSSKYKGKKYNCAEKGCFFVYPDRRALKRHMLNNHVKLVLPCPFCKVVFQKRPVCIQHIRNFHQNVGTEKLEKEISTLIGTKLTDFMTEIPSLWKKSDPKQYKCSLCNKILDRISLLKFHIAREHMKFSFKCNFCPKSFSRKNIYKYHLSEKHQDVGETKILEALEIINNKPIHELCLNPIPDEYKYLFD